MSEVVLVTSSRDHGVHCYDVASAATIASQFKNCLTERNSLCLLGKDNNSYNGSSRQQGDYIIASQASKPLLNIYQWNKPQIHLNCHQQEILSCICSDSTGNFLFGGSRRGWIYVWEVTSGELLKSFHGHFKTICKLDVDISNNYLVSSADDGIIRVWELDTLLQSTSARSIIGYHNSNNRKETITPYRSWSSHTLPVKDFIIIGNGPILRVVSCSMDRTVVIHDIHSGNQVLRITLPVPLEAITMNITEDYIFTGGANGIIYIINMTSQAMMISGNNARLLKQHDIIQLSNKGHQAATESYNTMEGHTKGITSLSCSMDGMTLVSSSLDGSVKFWNIWSQQCLREVKPFNGDAVTNALITKRHDIFATMEPRPTYASLGHLAKYPKNATEVTTLLSCSYIGGSHPVSTAHEEEKNYDVDSCRRAVGGAVNGNGLLHKNMKHKDEFLQLNHDNTEYEEKIISEKIVKKSRYSEVAIPVVEEKVKEVAAKEDSGNLMFDAGAVEESKQIEVEPTDLMEFLQQQKKKKSKGKSKSSK